jgi:hypothetical protein
VRRDLYCYFGKFGTALNFITGKNKMTLGKARFEHSIFSYVSFTSAALFVKEKQKRWYDVNAPPIGSDGIATFFFI